MAATVTPLKEQSNDREQQTEASTNNDFHIDVDVDVDVDVDTSSTSDATSHTVSAWHPPRYRNTSLRAPFYTSPTYMVTSTSMEKRESATTHVEDHGDSVADPIAIATPFDFQPPRHEFQNTGQSSRQQQRIIAPSASKPHSRSKTPYHASSSIQACLSSSHSSAPSMLASSIPSSSASMATSKTTNVHSSFPSRASDNNRPAERAFPYLYPRKSFRGPVYDVSLDAVPRVYHNHAHYSVTYNFAHNNYQYYNRSNNSDNNDNNTNAANASVSVSAKTNPAIQCHTRHRRPRQRRQHQHQHQPGGGNNRSRSGTAKDVHFNDIICGRGVPTLSHPGNQEFRSLVSEHEVEYTHARRRLKPSIAMQVLDRVRARGSRFVKFDKASQKWEDIGEHKSYEKVCQSLRDSVPDLRRQRVLASGVSSQQGSERERSLPLMFGGSASKQERHSPYATVGGNHANHNWKDANSPLLRMERSNTNANTRGIASSPSRDDHSDKENEVQRVVYL